MFLNTWNARLCGLAVLAGVSFLSARSASAATIIDAFDCPTMPGQAYILAKTTTQAPVSSSQAMTGMTNVIGGTRTIDMALQSGGGEMQTDINRFDEDLSVVSANCTNGVLGTFAFKYGFDRPQGLQADLSGDHAFTIDFVGADQVGGSLTLSVTSGLDSALLFTKSVSVNIPMTGGRVAIPFSAFGGINFADVDHLAYSISGPAAFDVTIDNFATAVPLPSAAWAGLGLLGTLGVNRIRKARNA